MLFAERWRNLTYSNEPNFINNALLVAKEYFHFKLSNVTKRATVTCAQCASRTAVLACSQCASRTEAPSNGLRKYHRRERMNERTEERTNPHSHVDFLNLIIDIRLKTRNLWGSPKRNIVLRFVAVLHLHLHLHRHESVCEDLRYYPCRPLYSVAVRW